jgi:phytoene dehydrogenase-like protein
MCNSRRRYVIHALILEPPVQPWSKNFSPFAARSSWPFLEDDEPCGTPVERWGVATKHSRILICGAGFRGGGGVSGLGGHNAAMAVLEGL